MTEKEAISSDASRAAAPGSGATSRLPKTSRALGRWTSRLIVISGIALALLCDAFVGLVLYTNYDETHRAVERADTDLVRVLDEYTQRTVQALQLSLRVTADQLDSNPAYLSPGNPDLIAALRRTISIYPAVQALVVLDADGNLIGDSLGNGVPGRRFNFSDRLYFQVHRNNPYSGLFIDVPRRARANANQYFIAVSIALRGPDDRFDGVVFAALDYEQIRQFFVSLDVGRNGAVNLLRDDGVLMVRVPAGEDYIGRSFDQNLLFLRYLPQASWGSYLGNNLAGRDDEIRRVTYRKIGGLPLIVSISRPEVEILALWRKGAWQYGAAAAALNFMIIALGFMLARQWRLREESQRATAAALAQARQVTDIVPAAIISVGPDLKIRFANSTVGDWYAKPVEQIIGQHISSFMPPPVLERFSPAIEAALLGQNSREEQRVILPDGQERWVDSTRVSDIAPEGTVRGFVTLAVDVTARHEADERLRESEEHFRKVFEMSPDSIYVHVDGKIVVANPAAARMYGFDRPEDLLGVETSVFRHPDSRDRILAHREALKRGEKEPLGKHLALRRDGTSFSVEAEATNFVWQGQNAILVVVRDVTEQIQAEQRLRESEKHFRKLFEISPDGVFVHVDGKIVVANQAAARTFGVPGPESLVGLDATVLHDPSSIDAIMKRRAGLLRGETPELLAEPIYRRRDGTAFAAEAEGISFVWQGRPAILVAVRDITERKKAEQRLREKEEHFRKLFEMSPDSIYVHVDGKIVVANPAAAEMFGFDRPEALLGVQTETLYHPDSLSKILVRRQKLMRGEIGEQLLEHRYRRRDGTEFAAEAEATNFIWQGQRAILVVVRDITERKRFEKELIAARDRAEIANRTKSEFLANMSHELRTPLNAIIGFAEILKDERLRGLRPATEYAAGIHQSGVHLLNIINDVLDMAKIEAGKVDLDEQIIEIDAEIDAALRMIAPRAQDSGLALKTEIARNLPSIYADRRVFKQIMLNLLSNAVKFTPSGGTVTVSAWRDGGGNLVVTVADTGIGIAEADLDRVLQPFGQADSGLARRYEGTGLGLPICKALTELHGGTIGIASAPGRGTTVTIRFPAERVRPRAA